MLKHTISLAATHVGSCNLSDLGLRASDVAGLKKALIAWSSAAVLRLDLGRNRLADAGATLVAEDLEYAALPDMA